MIGSIAAYSHPSWRSAYSNWQSGWSRFPIWCGGSVGDWNRPERTGIQPSFDILRAIRRAAPTRSSPADRSIGSSRDEFAHDSTSCASSDRSTPPQSPDVCWCSIPRSWPSSRFRIVRSRDGDIWKPVMPRPICPDTSNGIRRFRLRWRTNSARSACFSLSPDLALGATKRHIRDRPSGVRNDDIHR